MRNFVNQDKNGSTGEGGESVQYSTLKTKTRMTLLQKLSCYKLVKACCAGIERSGDPVSENPTKFPRTFRSLSVTDQILLQ